MQQQQHHMAQLLVQLVQQRQQATPAAAPATSVHISTNPVAFPTLTGIDRTTLADFREQYHAAVIKARQQALAAGVAFRAVPIITCIDVDCLVAICALGLLPPHRGMDPSMVPTDAIDDFVLGRGAYAPTPDPSPASHALKALRMASVGLPAQRVADFVVARHKLLRRHGVDAPHKRLIKNYILPGVNPPALRERVARLMEFDAAHRAAAKDLALFDALLFKEAMAHHKWAEYYSVGTGAASSDSCAPAASSSSSPNGGTSHVYRPPHQRTGDGSGAALYYALDRMGRGRLHRQKHHPTGGCYVCGEHHTYTKCPSATAEEKSRSAGDWGLLLSYARSLPPLPHRNRQ